MNVTCFSGPFCRGKNTGKISLNLAERREHLDLWGLRLPLAALFSILSRVAHPEQADSVDWLN